MATAPKKAPSKTPRLPYELISACLAPLATPASAHALWGARRVSHTFDAAARELLLKKVRRLLETRRGAALSTLLLNLNARYAGWFRIGILLREATGCPLEWPEDAPEDAKSASENTKTGSGYPHKGPPKVPVNHSRPSQSDLLISPFLVTLASHVSALDFPLPTIAPLVDALNLPRGDLAFFIEEAPVAEDDRVPVLGQLLWATRYPQSALRWIAWSGLEDDGGWWDPSARFRFLASALGIENDVSKIADELLLIARHGQDVITRCSRWDSFTLPPLPVLHHTVFPSTTCYLSAQYPGLETVGEILASKFPTSMLPAVFSRLYRLMDAPDPVRTVQNRRFLFSCAGMVPWNSDWGMPLCAEIIYTVAEGDGAKAAAVLESMPYTEIGGREQPLAESIAAVLGHLIGTAPVDPADRENYFAGCIAGLSWTPVKRRIFTILESLYSHASVGESFSEFAGKVWRRLFDRNWRTGSFVEFIERLGQKGSYAENVARFIWGLGWIQDAICRWKDPALSEDEWDVEPEFDAIVDLLFSRLRLEPDTAGLVVEGLEYAFLEHELTNGHYAVDKFSVVWRELMGQPIHMFYGLAPHLPFIALARSLVKDGDLARKYLPAMTRTLFGTHRRTGAQIIAIAVPPTYRALALSPLYHLDNADTTTAQEAAVLIHEILEAASEAEARNFARMLGCKRNSTREQAVVKAWKALKED